MLERRVPPDLMEDDEEEEEEEEEENEGEGGEGWRGGMETEGLPNPPRPWSELRAQRRVQGERNPAPAPDCEKAHSFAAMILSCFLRLLMLSSPALSIVAQNVLKHISMVVFELQVRISAVNSLSSQQDSCWLFGLQDAAPATTLCQMFAQRESGINQVCSVADRYACCADANVMCF